LAIADYTQAIRLNPNYVKAYGNRGIAYSDKNHQDRAIADFKRVLDLNPSSEEKSYIQKRLSEIGVK
jgi:tetratricopeptide (TPR) repeat protein